MVPVKLRRERLTPGTALLLQLLKLLPQLLLREASCTSPAARSASLLLASAEAAAAAMSATAVAKAAAAKKPEGYEA